MKTVLLCPMRFSVDYYAGDKQTLAASLEACALLAEDMNLWLNGYPAAVQFCQLATYLRRIIAGESSSGSEPDEPVVTEVPRGN